jgi:hypothetical protein
MARPLLVLLPAAVALIALWVAAAAARPLPLKSRCERLREAQTGQAGDISGNVDTTPPSVILHAPEQAESPRFGIDVEASDESGVAMVTISLDGIIVAGRTDPPYKFEITAPRLPVRVKALAADVFGNTGSAEAVVEGPPVPCACPEIYAPVCGVDGRTYGSLCEATCAGVEVAHDGSCEAKPCGEDGAACSEAQFCEFPVGTCGKAGETGECREQPQVCPRHFEPVCGCDGRTYPNDCARQAAGVSLAHPGPCEGMICGGPLMRPFDCPAGQFCELPAGACDKNVTGRCAAQPETCPKRPITAADAVCGCDGKTYGDDCERQMAGVSLAHPGACEEPHMCGGIASFPCTEGQVCDMRDPSCAIMDLGGKCVAEPESCPRLWAPVCGCDGKTYANDCERLKVGAVLAHPGECKPDCSLPPPNDWLACKADSDCVVIDGLGCCSCTMGGRQGAISKDRVADAERLRQVCCGNIACPAVMLCKRGLAAVCEDGMCRVQWPER